MTGFLEILALVAVYALACLARPYHTCWRCRGKRIARNRITGRPARCRACKGMGVKARPGARIVHSFYQHVHGEPDRARRMERLSRSQLEAEHDRQQLEQDS